LSLLALPAPTLLDQLTTIFNITTLKNGEKTFPSDADASSSAGSFSSG
jgi:hypothetical protein